METNQDRKRDVPAVFNPKKPWLWIILAAVVCAILAGCLVSMLKTPFDPVGTWVLQENRATELYDRIVSQLEFDADGRGKLVSGNSVSSTKTSFKYTVNGKTVRLLTFEGHIIELNYHSRNDSLRYTPDTGEAVDSLNPLFWSIELGVLNEVSSQLDKAMFEQVYVRDVPASDAAQTALTTWLDYRDASNELPWEETKELTLDAFPNVAFRWTSGAVEAVENGKTRTLFSGMPVWNVYLTDLTGDGRPELCATVSFGSGIIDEHLIVYDYAEKQSYTLWDRMQFDYHLYSVDGVLYVGKMPYGGDKQVDIGTLVMRDGVLSCRWQSDGSHTPLSRELHESELYGEWLVQEETDNDGNVLYTHALDDLWKEYNFREDGTVVYNETVPTSSDSEKAFGHPVSYPCEVHDNYVYIAGDDTSGAFRWGQYDRETGRLTLMYNTPERTVYATLRRMGADAEPSSESGYAETPEPSTFNVTETPALNADILSGESLIGKWKLKWMESENEADSWNIAINNALIAAGKLVWTYQFNADGTGEAYLYSNDEEQQQTFTYTIKGQAVTFSGETMEFRFEDGILILSESPLTCGYEPTDE